MSISFTSRYFEIFHYQIYSITRNRVFLLIYGILITVISREIYSGLNKNNSTLEVKIITFIVLLVIAIFGLAILNILIIAASLLFVPKYSMLYKNITTIKINDKEIKATTGGINTTMEWKKIKSIEMLSDIILVKVNDKLAFLIPARAFPDRKEAGRFYKTIEKYIERTE